MKVRYSPRSTRDLATIHRYLFQRTPSGCANVMTALHAAVEHIRQAPHAAEMTSMPGVRVKTVQRYRFRVFYRVLATGDAIEIVHIRHTSRKTRSDESD
ncbi:MAG: type II toxin-antitoxin system RelE/ParE family toxin [Xanthobacteraceae bacterium]|nr:type II toxin-antitoxin system RelE/ParE family toxin [Xanthobacteraceae bacterium]